MKDKVSIIIPAYNVDKYIYRAIESSIKQTYENIEIIIIDDGSTDNTWNIIKNYKKNDSRIIAIQQKNSGVSRARNEGLSVSTGKYVIFLDSDDWLERNAVEYLINLKKERKNNLISVDWFNAYMDDTGKMCRNKNYFEYTKIELNKKESIIASCEGKYRLKSACYKLYSLELIRKNSIKFNPSIKYGEDGLFVFEYLHYENGFYYVNEPLWNILDREGSATKITYNHSFMTAIEAVEIMKKISKNDKIDEIDKVLDIYLVRRALDILHTALSTKITKENYKDIKKIKIILKNNKNTYLSFVKNKKRKLYFYIMIYVPIYILNIYYRNKGN